MISKINSNYFNLSTQPANEKKEIKTEDTKQIRRVEEIKKQIESGEYKIDLDKTAKALAKKLL
jgi:anti-sigma28 factor (negative regulator of flagellin synthesis)